MVSTEDKDQDRSHFQTKKVRLRTSDMICRSSCELGGNEKSPVPYFQRTKLWLFLKHAGRRPSLSLFLFLILITEKEARLQSHPNLPSSLCIHRSYDSRGACLPPAPTKAATGRYLLFSLFCHKTPGKSNLRSVDLAQVSIVIARKVLHRSSQQLVTLHPRSGSRERWHSRP